MENKLGIEMPFDELYQWYSVAVRLKGCYGKRDKDPYCYLKFEYATSSMAVLTYKAPNKAYFTMNIPCTPLQPMPFIENGIRISMNGMGKLFKAPKKYKGSTVLLLISKDGVLGRVVEGYIRGCDTRKFHSFLVNEEVVERSYEVYQCSLPADTFLKCHDNLSKGSVFGRYMFSKQSLSYHDDFYHSAVKLPALRMRELSGDEGLYVWNKVMEVVFFATSSMKCDTVSIGMSQEFITFEFLGTHYASIRVLCSKETMMMPYNPADTAVVVNDTSTFREYIYEAKSQGFDYVTIYPREELGALILSCEKGGKKYSSVMYYGSVCEVSILDYNYTDQHSGYYNLSVLVEVLNHANNFATSDNDYTSIDITKQGIFVLLHRRLYFIAPVPNRGLL